jgi:hypothetical protein
MKRRTLVAVVGLALGSVLAAAAADVWARAGRGGSCGFGNNPWKLSAIQTT